jgi:LacI family transcriptional regulator
MTAAPGATPRRITMADVARYAKVDSAVVSRVLSHDPNLSIRDETRARVLATVQALGYRPNAAARSLRTARSGTLGLFLPDFNNPVYAEIITGAEAAAAARGYVLVTGSSSAVGVTAQTYLDLLGQGRVDGLLLAGYMGTTHLQSSLHTLGLPYLFVNRRHRGSRRHVILDDERAAQIAVQHLVDLGHRRIGHLAGPRRADTARRRQAGYTAALRAAGLPYDGAMTVAADYTPAGGAQAMIDLLQRRPRPTAVLVANFAASIGALRAAQTLGVAVPDELSVVAIHDSALGDFLSPPLTAVKMPLQQMGERAVNSLLTEPAEAAVTEVVSGPIHLTIRQSTAPVARVRTSR